MNRLSLLRETRPSGTSGTVDVPWSQHRRDAVRDETGQVWVNSESHGQWWASRSLVIVDSFEVTL